MIIRGWLCELARTRDVTASHVEPITLHPPLRNLRHGRPPFRQENVSASCRLHPPERCERGSHDNTAAVYGIRAHHMHNGSILPAHVCIRDDVLLRPHPQHCIGGQALGIDLFVYNEIQVLHTYVPQPTQSVAPPRPLLSRGRSSPCSPAAARGCGPAARP
jgi:hypothetical protein